jgi:AsmA protein
MPMKKFFKIIVWSLTLFILVVGGVIAYVAATFDPNKYKPQIVQEVKEKTGRTLKLDGDIKLSFFPRIGASLGKASLSEHDSNQEFAAFDDLHVAVALIPLLSKQVVVDGIEVTNLRAHLTRLKNGKTSIDDLTTPSLAQSAPQAQESTAQPVAIDIDHITIKNADIGYTDDAVGSKYELSQLDLTTGRVALGVPTKIELSGHIQSDSPKFDLDLTLDTTLTFDLDKQQYRLDGIDFRTNGVAPGISDLVATAKGDVDAQLASKEFLISGLAITATGKQPGGDLDVKLDVPQLTITEQKVSGEKIVLDAKVSAVKSRIEVKLDIPSIAGTKQSFTADALTADMQMWREGMTAQAKLSSSVTGNLDTQRFELAKFQTTIHVENPQLPRNPIDAIVTGSALADIDNQNASLTFATKLDDSTISGKMGLTKFTPPYYTFDIDIDKLDADRYLPRPAPAVNTTLSSAAPAGDASPEQPLDLSALKELDASGSLKIGALKIKNIKVTNTHIVVKAENGKLDVNPLTANLYQGILSGALSVNIAGTPAIAVKQNLTGIMIGPLLKDAANSNTLEGKGNITLDVSGQGATVSAIKKALNGSAAIKLADGAINGINIGAKIRDIKSKLAELKGEQAEPASATDKTDFSELSATFSIKNGVAHNSDLAGKSPLLRLGGEGDIDIGNESFDYLLKATVVATAAGQGGKELADLKGVTVPVRLSGPFSAPQYKIDFNGILEGLTKGKIEEKKEEIKNQFQDKLQDKLKGLFNH